MIWVERIIYLELFALSLVIEMMKKRSFLYNLGIIEA